MASAEASLDGVTSLPPEEMEGSKLGWGDLAVIILYFVFVLAVGLWVRVTLRERLG